MATRSSIITVGRNVEGAIFVKSCVVLTAMSLEVLHIRASQLDRGKRKSHVFNGATALEDTLTCLLCSSQHVHYVISKPHLPWEQRFLLPSVLTAHQKARAMPLGQDGKHRRFLGAVRHGNVERLVDAAHLWSDQTSGMRAATHNQERCGGGEARRMKGGID